MVAKQTSTSSIKSFLHAKDHRSKVQPKPHVAAINRQQALLQSIASVYAGSMGQAVVLQRLFDEADGLILAEDALVRIARRICSTWEPQQQTPSYVAAFVKFIKFILSHTNQPGEPYTLDFAQRICHHRRSAFPTVHAPLVLLLALGYLERLSLRYRDTRGEPGCAQRLFLISYTVAAKYLHANLAFISLARPPTAASNSGESCCSPPSSPVISRAQSPTNTIQSCTTASSTIKSEPVTSSSLSPPMPSNYGGTGGPRALAAPPAAVRTVSGGGVSAASAATAAAATAAAAIAITHSHSLTTMTTSTHFLSRVIPNVTTRELYRMELEFLYFLSYDLAVYNVAEIQSWRQLYVGTASPSAAAAAAGFCAESRPDKETMVKHDKDEADTIKMEDEDEGIGHYEAVEDGFLMM